MIEHVKAFLIENGIYDIKLSTDCKNGSAAMYDFTTNVMGINEEAFYIISEKYDIPIEDAVILIISHELGHYLDEELPDLHDKKISVLDEAWVNIAFCDLEKVINEATSYVLKAEDNAWILGERFIPSRLLEKYTNFKIEALARQKNATENEIHYLLSKMITAEMLKRDL